jgi:hypothetical protein
MVEAAASKGHRQKMKPWVVMDNSKYKIDIDKSNQVLACDSFQRKSV